MEIIIIIAIILITIVLLSVFKNSSSFDVRSPGVKKEQIVQNYVDELKEILREYDTKEEKTAQKKLYLQKVNSELCRNIFFNEDEAKELLKKLSVL